MTSAISHTHRSQMMTDLMPIFQVTAMFPGNARRSLTTQWCLKYPCPPLCSAKCCSVSSIEGSADICVLSCRLVLLFLCLTLHGGLLLSARSMQVPKRSPPLRSSMSSDYMTQTNIFDEDATRMPVRSSTFWTCGKRIGRQLEVLTWILWQPHQPHEIPHRLAARLVKRLWGARARGRVLKQSSVSQTFSSLRWWEGCPATLDAGDVAAVPGVAAQEVRFEAGEVLEGNRAMAQPAILLILEGVIDTVLMPANASGGKRRLSGASSGSSLIGDADFSLDGSVAGAHPPPAQSRRTHCVLVTAVRIPRMPLQMHGALLQCCTSCGVHVTIARDHGHAGFSMHKCSGFRFDRNEQLLTQPQAMIRCRYTGRHASKPQSSCHTSSLQP